MKLPVQPGRSVKWLAAAAIAVCQSVHGQAFREQFASVTAENFDSGGAVSRQFHLNVESYLPTAQIAAVGAVKPLPMQRSTQLATTPVVHRGGSSSFDEYVRSDPLTDGVVILHRGAIVYEAFTHMEAWQRHFAWSVTKVLTSATLAALVQQDKIDMQATVDRYVPALRDSAWAGIPLQHLADMASGINCLDSDGYQDKSTCVYAMEESLGITAPTGRDLDFLEQIRSMEMHREAGRVNEYVSANTNVLGLVIEAVTDKPYATAVQELIWSPMGAESDALMTVSKSGYAYASGGLHARLRDVARFGLLFVDSTGGGVFEKATVTAMQRGGIPLSEEDQRDARESFGSDLPVRSSWQWDYVWSDGAMYKGGYSGQGLYVDPGRELVVTWFGTGINFDEQINEMLPVTRQLVATDVFAPAR